jgi:hypothetical protein
MLSASNYIYSTKYGILARFSPRPICPILGFPFYSCTFIVHLLDRRILPVKVAFFSLIP